MTKKEFMYWKEHKDMLLKKSAIYFRFNIPVTVNRVYIQADLSYKTPNPNICYVTNCIESFNTGSYEIIDIWFDEDKITIEMQRRHAYLNDVDIKTILIGEPIINSFKRKNIERIYFDK